MALSSPAQPMLRIGGPYSLSRSPEVRWAAVASISTRLTIELSPCICYVPLFVNLLDRDAFFLGLEARLPTQLFPLPETLGLLRVLFSPLTHMLPRASTEDILRALGTFVSVKAVAAVFASAVATDRAAFVELLCDCDTGAGVVALGTLHATISASLAVDLNLR